MRSILYAAQQVVQNVVAYIRKDKLGYYRFGDDDKLPNDIIYKVNDSGTARACVSKLSAFIQANGFVNENGKAKANKRQTFNGLLSDIALSVSYIPCACFRVLYDNTGTPVKAIAVSTDYVRRKGNYFLWWENPDDIGYSYLNKATRLDEFDPEEPPLLRMKRINEQIIRCGEQKGDLVYHFRKGVGKYYDKYPVPEYYSGMPDIESDAAIARLELRNITKGFRTPVIISTGPIDNVTKNENGKTDKDLFNDNVKRFAGEDAAFALHLEGSSEEVKPTVTTINIAEILNQTDAATKRVGEKVCRNMCTPPVLVGFSTPGQLGNNQELVNTIKLFNMTIVNRQSLISEAFKMVWPTIDWNISTLKIFDFLPSEILNILTEDEKRQLYELKPRPNETTEGAV